MGVWRKCPYEYDIIYKWSLSLEKCSGSSQCQVHYEAKVREASLTYRIEFGGLTLNKYPLRFGWPITRDQSYIDFYTLGHIWNKNVRSQNHNARRKIMRKLALADGMRMRMQISALFCRFRCGFLQGFADFCLVLHNFVKFGFFCINAKPWIPMHTGRGWYRYSP